MTRPILSLARSPKRNAGPSFSRIRQAVRLFRNGYGSREQRKFNARNWLRAVESLGSKWVYATTTHVRDLKEKKA